MGILDYICGDLHGYVGDMYLQMRKWAIYLLVKGGYGYLGRYISNLGNIWGDLHEYVGDMYPRMRT